MRVLTAVLLASLGAAGLSAQQNDFAGIMIRADGMTAPVNQVRSLCGDTFSCTPLTLNALRGDSVQDYITGTFGDPFLLIGSADTRFLGCTPLTIPGLVNQLILLPSPLTFTLAVGATDLSDNGRCNGGATALTPLFTIPMNIGPGAMAFQAAAGTPLSSGGNGFALTRAVVVNFQ